MGSAPQTAAALIRQPAGGSPASGAGDTGDGVVLPASVRDGDRPSEQHGTAKADDPALSLSRSGGTSGSAPPEAWWRLFPGRPDQLAGVRAFLASALADCPAVADVILMADELASNAVLHSNSREPGGTFGLRVLVRQRESVRIEVSDAGGKWARPDRADHAGCDGVTDSYRTGGRGLLIVSELAAAWGVTGHDAGRTVWFTAAWKAV